LSEENKLSNGNRLVPPPGFYNGFNGTTANLQQVNGKHMNGNPMSFMPSAFLNNNAANLLQAKSLSNCQATVSSNPATMHHRNNNDMLNSGSFANNTHNQILNDKLNLKERMSIKQNNDDCHTEPPD